MNSILIYTVISGLAVSGLLGAGVISSFKRLKRDEKEEQLGDDVQTDSTTVSTSSNINSQDELKDIEHAIKQLSNNGDTVNTDVDSVKHVERFPEIFKTFDNSNLRAIPNNLSKQLTKQQFAMVKTITTSGKLLNTTSTLDKLYTYLDRNLLHMDHQIAHDQLMQTQVRSIDALYKGLTNALKLVQDDAEKLYDDVITDQISASNFLTSVTDIQSDNFTAEKTYVEITKETKPIFFTNKPFTLADAYDDNKLALIYGVYNRLVVWSNLLKIDLNLLHNINVLAHVNNKFVEPNIWALFEPMLTNVKTSSQLAELTRQLANSNKVGKLFLWSSMTDDINRDTHNVNQEMIDQLKLLKQELFKIYQQALDASIDHKHQLVQIAMVNNLTNYLDKQARIEYYKSLDEQNSKLNGLNVEQDVNEPNSKGKEN